MLEGCTILGRGLPGLCFEHLIEEGKIIEPDRQRDFGDAHGGAGQIITRFFDAKAMQEADNGFACTLLELCRETAHAVSGIQRQLFQCQVFVIVLFQMIDDTENVRRTGIVSDRTGVFFQKASDGVDQQKKQQQAGGIAGCRTAPKFPDSAGGYRFPEAPAA